MAQGLTQSGSLHSTSGGFYPAPLSPALSGIVSTTDGAALTGGSSASKKDPKKNFEYDVAEFERRLKQGKHLGSGKAAVQTVVLLRTVISKSRFSTVEDLINNVREVGRRLILARPLELVIGNTVRRILFIIRRELSELSSLQQHSNVGSQQTKPSQPKESLKLEEKTEKVTSSASTATTTGDNQQLNPSILDMFHFHPWKNALDMSAPLGNRKEYKSAIIGELNQLKEEIENVYHGIEEYSLEHIHSNEVILTYDISQTVLHFLSHASKTRNFEVICCESAPSMNGHKMAKQLLSLKKRNNSDDNVSSNNGIVSVTVISDSSIFAIMSRVNKVIIGCHSVLANGGLLSHAGTHALAIAAKYYRVPIVVVTGLYKLSPLYAFDQDTFQEMGDTNSIIPYEEAAASHLEATVFIQNPTFDYVPPQYVDLFVTNGGGHSPSYIYRLLSEYYNTLDYNL